MYTLEQVGIGSIWIHEKGGIYVVIGVSQNSTNGCEEEEPYVVYWSCSYKALRHRKASEFLDGRFKPANGHGDVACGSAMGDLERVIGGCIRVNAPTEAGDPAKKFDPTPQVKMVPCAGDAGAEKPSYSSTAKPMPVGTVYVGVEAPMANAMSPVVSEAQVRRMIEEYDNGLQRYISVPSVKATVALLGDPARLVLTRSCPGRPDDRDHNHDVITVCQESDTGEQRPVAVMSLYVARTLASLLRSIAGDPNMTMIRAGRGSTHL